MMSFKPATALFALLILTCFASTGIQAQSLKGKQLTDSLLQALSQSKDDTSKIKTLYRLARIYAVNDSTTAFKYANQCLALSKKNNWQKGIGLSYYAKAIALKNVSNYSAAIEFATNAFNIFKSINSEKDIASALVVIGNCYQGSGYYTKAIENNLAALKVFESIKDSFDISVCYNNIGVNYYYLKEYDKAINYYQQSLVIYMRAMDAFGIGSALDNIAIVYLDEKKFDSANIYDLKAIPYFISSNNLPGVARIYENRGSILMKLNNADSAYVYFQQALAINTKLNITDGIASNYGDFGSLYLDVANDSSGRFLLAPFMNKNKHVLLDSTIYFLIKAVNIDKGEDDLASLMNHYELLSEAEEKQGNYANALAHHKLYTLYKDSIFNDANKHRIEVMETERLTEIKDKQIALQASEVKRQTLIRNIILIWVVVLGALAFLFIHLYNKKRKTKFDTRVMEVEMKALRAQMNPHFIFNSLHSINKYVMDNDKKNASAYLSKFANLMRLILENSREQEVPLEQDLDALELYMQLEALRFKNSFTYNIEVDETIDKENTLIPPMLLQPFVENSILHGIQDKENGVIKINIQQENEMIRCIVEDNGSGKTDEMAFAYDENKKHKSLGKKIISERLSIINQLKKAKASVNIFDVKDNENKPGGIRVELLLPLELAFN